MTRLLIDHFNVLVSNISIGATLIIYYLNVHIDNPIPPNYILDKAGLCWYYFDLERVKSICSIVLRSSFKFYPPTTYNLEFIKTETLECLAYDN